MEVVETFKVVLEFNVMVDPDTGALETHCIKKTIDKAGFKVSEDKPKRSSKKKKEESNIPTLTLEDNKYCLNTAAVELMELTSEDKLDIKYQKIGKSIVPIIATDNTWGTHGGNKLTKTFTVACRGSKNTELAKYGNSFTIVPHNETVGLFILQNGGLKVEENDPELEDLEQIEEDIAFPVDEDLQNLIDDVDVTEVPASIFKL